MPTSTQYNNMIFPSDTNPAIRIYPVTSMRSLKGSRAHRLTAASLRIAAVTFQSKEAPIAKEKKKKCRSRIVNNVGVLSEEVYLVGRGMASIAS